MARAKKESFSKTTVALADFADALSHPARIEILRIIGLSKSGELPCMEIFAKLPLSQPACSRHMSILRQSELVYGREDASYIYYRVCPDVLQKFCQAMHANLAPAMNKKPLHKQASSTKSKSTAATSAKQRKAE